MTNATEIQAGLDRVRQRFLSLLEKRLDILDQQVYATTLPNTSAEFLNIVQAEAHKIAGTAPMLGFNEMGQIAADIDTLIDSSSVEDFDDQMFAQLQSKVDLLVEIGDLALCRQSAYKQLDA